MSDDVGAVRPRGWGRELVLVSVLYVVYAASRLPARAQPDVAERNGLRVLDLERTLHLAPEHTLNDGLYALPRWVSVAAAYFYETMHYAMTVAVLIWLYRSSAVAYRRARNWLAAMTFPALLVFWLYPVAPPRSVLGAVAHDTVADQHQFGWWGAGGGSAPRGLAALVNENAALPSLHVGWALWAGWQLSHRARSPWLRAFGHAYPAVTIVVVLSTGNHFLVDVLAGGLLAFLAKIFADRVGSVTRAAAVTCRPHVGTVPWPKIARRAAIASAAGVIVTFDAHLFAPYAARAAAELRHPAFEWVVIALAAEIVSLAAAARLQRRMLMVSGIRVTMPAMIGVTYASYAMSLSLPAGQAVSTGYTYRRLRQLGATISTAGFALITSGAFSTLAYGLLALVGLVVVGGSTGGLAAAAIGSIMAVLLGIAARSLLARPHLLERIAVGALHAINRVLRRAPDAGTDQMRHSTGMLAAIRPRGRDWAAGTASALINWIADLGCLLASCLAVGAHGATVGVVLLAYLGGTSVSGISLVPGGLGVVDAAMIVILVRYGVGPAPAAAAVLLYRLLSSGFVVVTGWAAWFANRHRRVLRTDRSVPARTALTGAVRPR